MPFPKDLKSFIFSKKQSNDVMMSEQNVVTDLVASWLWMFAQRKKQRFKWTLTFERGFEFSNCLCQGLCLFYIIKLCFSLKTQFKSTSIDNAMHFKCFQQIIPKKGH